MANIMWNDSREQWGSEGLKWRLLVTLLNGP